MQKIPFKRFLPAVLWFVIVMVLTCMPGKDVPDISWLDSINFDKWVHMGLFGGLTFLLCWPLKTSVYSRRERVHLFIKIALVSSIWGLIVEFLQRFYIPGRDYDLWDWAADSLGSFLALLICLKYFVKNPVDHSK
jgi:VanZ family protein